MKTTLNSVQWNAKKVDGWTSNIVEHCLKRLAEMKKPFKYIVTAIVMQKTGAGLHSAFTAYWDNSADGMSLDRIVRRGWKRCRLSVVFPEYMLSCNQLPFVIALHLSAGICSVPYENDSVHCITTVYGLKLD